MEDKDTSFEVLGVCEGSSQPWPINFYNPLTGAAVWSYKGVEMNDDEPQDAILVDKNYLLIPTVKKPLVLQVGFESKNRTLQKSFLSSPLQCLAVSSDGIFCCGSIDKNIYTWILSSGKLCSIVTGHLQAITKILFTSDNSKVVTSGKDGSILAWNLEDLLSTKSSMSSTSNISAWRKWNSHSLSVTDMKLGRGGGACRVYSVSADQTAQIHDLCSGDLLMTLRFDSSLTTCAIDNAENNFYVGSSKGDIMRVCLSEEPVLRERHLDFLSNTEDKWLKAHKESVVCLSVNIDGTFLASGGNDDEIKIWHVASRQCIKTIHCKGKPKRVEFHVKFPALSGNCPARISVVHPLQKVVNEKVDENLAVRLFGSTSNSIDERNVVDQLMEDLLQEEKLQQFKALQVGQDNRDLSQDVEHLRRELAKTKKINKHLYDMCVNFATK